jgi:hypothetical protein
LLDQPPATTPEPADAIAELPPRDACPQCGTGRLVVVATLAPVGAPPHTTGPLAWDTSWRGTRPAPTSRPPAAHRRERLAACAALLRARCTHRMPRVARRADRRPSAPERADACAPPRSPPAASFNPHSA